MKDNKKPHKFKKILTALLIATFTPLPSFALEVGKPYIKVETGFSLLAKNPNKEEYSKKAKGAPLYGAGFGYKFTDHIRGEISILSSGKYKYRGSSTDKKTETQDIKTSAVMLSGYYDFQSYKNFTPYLTLGMGYASHTVSDINSGENFIKGATHKVGSWNVGSGVLYKIKNNMYIDFAYKYYDFNKISTSSSSNTKDKDFGYVPDNVDPIKGKLRTHSFLIGYIYNF